MNFSRCILAASLIAAAIAVDACGSSNSSSSAPFVPASAPTAVPIAAPAAFTASSTVPAPAAAAAVALPTNSVYSGAIDLGAPTSPIPPGTTIADILSDVAPSTAQAPALSDALRHALAQRIGESANGAIVVLAYVNLLYSNTVTYASAPSFSLTVPAAQIANAAYYVAAFDPARPTLGWQLGFSSVGSVSGSTLSFKGASTPFTFDAGANYYFAVYAISSAAVAPTPAPSIVPIVPTAAPVASPTSTPLPSPTATAVPTITPTAVPTVKPTVAPVPSPTASAPAASPTPTLPPGTVALSGGATIVLPVVNSYTGTVTLPAASSSTTATVLTSTLVPQGVTAAPGTVLFYAAVTPAGPITFTSGTVTGTILPKVIGPSALTGTYHLDLFAPGLGWIVGTVNSTPTANGGISFAYPLTQAIPLTAGARYVFAVTH